MPTSGASSTWDRVRAENRVAGRGIAALIGLGIAAAHAARDEAAMVALEWTSKSRHVALVRGAALRETGVTRAAIATSWSERSDRGRSET